MDALRGAFDTLNMLIESGNNNVYHAEVFTRACGYALRPGKQIEPARAREIAAAAILVQYRQAWALVQAARYDDAQPDDVRETCDTLSFEIEERRLDLVNILVSVTGTRTLINDCDVLTDRGVDELIALSAF